MKAVIWICPRVDEPATWRLLPDSHEGACADCGTAIVYRQSTRSPKAAEKVCVRCACKRMGIPDYPPYEPTERR